MKGNDFYYNPSTNEMELKSNPSPLRPKEEDHPAEKHYEEELNRIEKRGKSWLVKHLKKEDPTTGAVYTSKLDQVMYPKHGTAPAEIAAAKKLSNQERRKILYDKKWGLNDTGPVKYDKNGYPDKATPAQVGEMAKKFEEMRQMTGEPDKPKPKKKINPYSEVKIPIPKINFSLMRDSDPKQEAREAALEKLRVSAFTEIPDPDRWRGIGALATPTVKKLKAADWLKRNQTTYEK
tara:strand:- start:1411 stop:2115 length:705 start_codon:yes stop_codon:yes gene_type:complete